MKRQEIEKINEAIELLQECCKSNCCGSCEIKEWCAIHNPNVFETWKPIKIEPKSIYDLKDGDDYWCIDESSLDIYEDMWTDCVIDKRRLRNGYIYLTYEEAKTAQKTLKILEKYSHNFSDEEWAEETIRKYYINYNYQRNALSSDFTMGEKNRNLYFKTKEDIKKAIEEAGEENIIKYYFNVDR